MVNDSNDVRFQQIIHTRPKVKACRNPTSASTVDLTLSFHCTDTDKMHGCSLLVFAKQYTAMHCIGDHLTHSTLSVVVCNDHKVSYELENKAMLHIANLLC